MMKRNSIFAALAVSLLGGMIFDAILRGEEPPKTIAVDSTPEIQWTLASGAAKSAGPACQALTPAGSDVWYDSTYWANEVEWCRVGKNWQHPGSSAASVRTFNAPKDGEIEITGDVAKFHVAADTDGVSVSIRQNDRTLWSADIDGGDERGYRPYLRFQVKQGDRVHFVVDKRKTIGCDTTRWDPVVAYTDGGGKFHASEMFSDKADGEKIWTYESLPTGDESAPPFPADYATNYSAMIQYEWLREDKIASGGAAAFLAAAQKHLGLAATLLDDLADALPDDEYTALRDSLDRLTAEEKTVSAENASAEKSSGENNFDERAELLYANVRGLKRKIALANPLTQFGKMLFVKRKPSSYSHLVMQYFGWRARPGGGIFILDEPGKSLQCRDLFGDKLPSGNVLEPRISFDAKKLLFSFVDLSLGREYDPYKMHFSDPDEGFYHIWSANLDGSDLKQLTNGPFDDITPNWLADGDIVFSSTRRKGYARCFWWGFGERWHVYTIARMKPDGSKIKTLSWHDTNEWFPEVSNNGSILYARWDYIDRDAVTHQNLWAMRPDGTNPAAVWGNATPKPHCTFQTKPIPESGKYVFTASAHHSITGGPIVLLDPSVGVDGQEALTRITPEVPFPEAESMEINEFYDSPNPLSEKYFLVSYSPYRLHWEGQAPNRENGLGIYLLDVFGNRELIYRDPAIGATNPTPLTARAVPPVPASQLPPESEAPDWGEMTITDIYQGLGDKIERGRIKEVRVVQLFPKTTRDADVPPIGMAREENGRAILGTAPVEADGSAYFRVPAQTPFYLQAIDADGFAYQTMRSLTYLQPGEKVSCTGCHEKRDTSAYAVAENLSAASATRPLATQRAVSTLNPGPFGGRPFSYPEAVQPILDAKCVSCHNAEKKEGGFDLTGRPEGAFSQSYVALMSDRDFWGGGTNPKNAAEALVPRFGGRNQIQMTEPGGQYGALGSRLMKLLAAGHEKTELSDQEKRTLATWIDLNAIFYGVGEVEGQAKILAGEQVPMPAIQ